MSQINVKDLINRFEEIAKNNRNQTTGNNVHTLIKKFERSISSSDSGYSSPESGNTTYSFRPEEVSDKIVGNKQGATVQSLIDKFNSIGKSSQKNSNIRHITAEASTNELANHNLFKRNSDQKTQVAAQARHEPNSTSQLNELKVVFEKGAQTSKTKEDSLKQLNRSTSPTMRKIIGDLEQTNDTVRSTNDQVVSPTMSEMKKPVEAEMAKPSIPTPPPMPGISKSSIPTPPPMPQSIPTPPQMPGIVKQSIPTPPPMPSASSSSDRGALLNQIRDGIKLKHVEDKDKSDRSSPMPSTLVQSPMVASVARGAMSR